jgi:hypothetical protein
MAQLTADWDPAERKQFCGLLTRFNTALSARQAAVQTTTTTTSPESPESPDDQSAS